MASVRAERDAALAAAQDALAQALADAQRREADALDAAKQEAAKALENALAEVNQQHGQNHAALEEAIAAAETAAAAQEARATEAAALARQDAETAAQFEASRAAKEAEGKQEAALAAAQKDFEEEMKHVQVRLELVQRFSLTYRTKLRRAYFPATHDDKLGVPTTTESLFSEFPSLDLCSICICVGGTQQSAP